MWLVFAVLAISAQSIAIAPEIQTHIFKGVPDNWADSIDIAPFVKIGKKYYLIEPHRQVNWFEAAQQCAGHNAQLASIENSAELTALTEYFQKKKWHLWFWTSGNDLAKEGSYYWFGTGQPVSYARWAQHEPNNADGNENCLHLAREGEKFLLNDRNCSHTLNFLCEARTPKTIAFTLW